MRRRLNACDRLRHQGDETTQSSAGQGPNQSLGNDEVLAALIDAGVAPWPTDRVVNGDDALVAKVRDLRRQRLFRFIAELVAKSITLQQTQKDEGL